MKTTDELEREIEALGLGFEFKRFTQGGDCWQLTHPSTGGFMYLWNHGHELRYEPPDCDNGNRVEAHGLSTVEAIHLSAEALTVRDGFSSFVSDDFAFTMLLASLRGSTNHQP
jgi:hypothetical protein